MSTLVTIILVLLVAVGALLAFAATKPDVFRVERAITIKAPPEKVFALIEDFRRWQAWSPWEHRDPALKRSYSGPPSGKGAVYAWEGNRNVGQGRMETVDAAPPNRLALKLDFIKPFEAHNDVVFTLEPVAEGTRVTWTMTGPVPFLAKIMHVFVNMDRMVGKDFETGLANLKAAAEQ